MTPDEVRTRIEHIQQIASDDEVAHGAEDSLHQDVLAAIAKGECGQHARACAEIALETQSIRFSRWCA